MWEFVINDGEWKQRGNTCLSCWYWDNKLSGGWIRGMRDGVLFQGVVVFWDFWSLLLLTNIVPFFSRFSMWSINHWLRSSFSHLPLYRLERGASACYRAQIPPEMPWRLARWAVPPFGTMEFGQACKPLPHQTLTTVESSVVVGQIQL